jgi:7-cyano-7-deazaguanine synthase in queuosine biosynthesis
MTTYTVKTDQGEQEILIRKLPVDKIGIYTSGGIDSTLLLELYARENIPFTPYYLDRHEPKEYVAALRIIERINQRHGLDLELVNIEIELDPEGPGDFIEGMRFLGDKVQCMITGDNLNPPDYVIADSNTEAPGRLPVEKQYNYDNWELPLLHVDKSYIIKLALDLDCEWIFELARTCGIYYNTFEPYMIEAGQLRCDKCFYCKERAWGFQMCNSTDPGIE